MNDIKIKKKGDIKIKKFEKAQVYTQKLKNNIVTIRNRTNESNTEETATPTEYGTNKITDSAKHLANGSVDKYNKYGKKAVKETKENIEKAKDYTIQTKDKIKKKFAENKMKRAEEKSINAVKSNTVVADKNIIREKENIKSNFANSKLKGKIKTKSNMVNRNIKVNQARNYIPYNKTSNLKYAKNTLKNAPKTVKRTLKNAPVVMKKSQVTVSKGYKVSKLNKDNIKKIAKAIGTTIKGVIQGTKALILALIAGGWIAVFLIILVCLIGLICSSVFGIFFSNEKHSTNTNTKQMSSVITEINTEFVNKITTIQNNTSYDDFEIDSNRATWKDVLSVYAVSVTNGKNQSSVMILDESQVEKLKKVFWDMNEITSKTEEVEKDIEIINDDGTTKIEKQTRKVLYITVKSKTVEEMTTIYNFNNDQMTQLAEIRKDEYNKMWSNVLYGSTTGSTDIVEVAFSQIGNVGGEYWSWYGFKERVSWCACFVSYCANECGYIDSGIIPKFAACQNEGVEWFKTCGLWQDGGGAYIPKEGDIIFFDWLNKHDGHSDHVRYCSKG